MRLKVGGRCAIYFISKPSIHIKLLKMFLGKPFHDDKVTFLRIIASTIDRGAYVA